MEIETKTAEDLLGFYTGLMELYAAQSLTAEPLAEAALTPKWVVVRGSGCQCGLSFRFNGEHAVHGALSFRPILERLPAFVGQPISRLAEWLLGLEGLEARIFCLAALNALSAPFNRPQALAERGWSLLPPRRLPFLRPSDRVVCVGYGCLIDEVLAVCPQVHVSDMRPRQDLETCFAGQVLSYGPEGVVFHSAGENPQLLAGADVVLITGCTLANGTWSDLLCWAEHARVVGLFGPSAGLPPELLARAGFQYVTTSHVTSPACLARNLRRPLTDPFQGRCAQGYSLML